MEKTLYELFPDCDVIGLENFKITDSKYLTDKTGKIISQEPKPPFLYQVCCGVKIFHLFAVNTRKNTARHIDIGDGVAVFVSGECSGMKEVRELARKKQAKIIAANQIYRAFYEMDDEMFTRFAYGYSGRTKKYLDSVKQKLGMISYSMEEDDGVLTDNMVDVYHWPPLQTPSSVTIGRVKDQWLAEFEKQFALDGWLIVKIKFGNKPTEEMFLGALEVIEVETYFLEKKIPPSALADGKIAYWDQCDYKEHFICNGCGRSFHWTSGDGGITEKFNRLITSQCGCLAEKTQYIE